MFEPTLNPKDRRIEWLMVFALLALMVIGAAFIYSATVQSETARGIVLYKRIFFRQIVFYTLGLGCAIAICIVDYRRMARWSLVTYWVSILFLVGVLIPFIGSTHNWGARRWIDLGPFGFQPSEFAKIAFIMAQAHFLSRPADELREPLNFWKGIGLMALPFVLIFKEPDLGSALVLVPTGLAMLFAAGTPRRYLLQLLGSAALLAMLLLVDVLFAPTGWWKIKLEDYQRQRLLVYFGVDFASTDASPEAQARARRLQWEKSYQVRQALISVGSGGFTGQGWCKGNQTALGFLPPGAAHNDFIFSVIAEEKGFLGSVTVLALYAVILFTGIRIAGQSRDRLGKLLAVGVVTLLFSHVFINIGMNIRLMPVTGIPLPLLSYGGTSVLCTLVAAGILHNIHLYSRS